MSIRKLSSLTEKKMNRNDIKLLCGLNDIGYAYVDSFCRLSGDGLDYSVQGIDGNFKAAGAIAFSIEEFIKNPSKELLQEYLLSKTTNVSGISSTQLMLLRIGHNITPVFDSENAWVECIPLVGEPIFTTSDIVISKYAYFYSDEQTQETLKYTEENFLNQIIYFENPYSWLYVPSSIAKGITCIFSCTDRSLQQTCFIEGSRVKLEDGTYKAIEEIVPGDILPYLRDDGTYSTTKVVLPPEEGFCKSYSRYTFSDGTILDIYGDQGIWCVEENKYKTVLRFSLGEHTKKLDGSEIELLSIKKIDEEKRHYFLYTMNGNYTVNDVLTCTSRVRAYSMIKRKNNEQYLNMLSEEEFANWEDDVIWNSARRDIMIYPDCKREVILLEDTLKKKITECTALKKYLDDTDYLAIKVVDGRLSEEEYAPTKQKRAETVLKIQEYEKEVEELTQQIEDTKSKYRTIVEEHFQRMNKGE